VAGRSESCFGLTFHHASYVIEMADVLGVPSHPRDTHSEAGSTHCGLYGTMHEACRISVQGRGLKSEKEGAQK
jgi:hypothetical protein